MFLLYKILSMTSTCVGIEKKMKKMDPKNIFNELVFGIPNGPMLICYIITVFLQFMLSFKK